MKTATKPNPPYSLVMHAQTAADLMTANPVSLRDAAFVSEAVSLLTDRGFSAAPVIDGAGRPVGVVSRTDLLIHDREQNGCLPPADWYDEADLKRDFGETESAALHVHRIDATRVSDIMTPAVFGVAPDAPVASVVEQMVGLNVHRLFVIDADGILVGVISALDVLRFLSRD